MSSLGRWTYTEELTIWPFEREDKNSVPVYGAPYLLTGDWEEGGSTETDETGEQFVATSKYYFEAPDGDPLIPTRADYILRGDNRGETSPVEAGAEKIQKVGGWNMKMFGPEEIPDWVIMT